MLTYVVTFHLFLKAFSDVVIVSEKGDWLLLPGTRRSASYCTVGEPVKGLGYRDDQREGLDDQPLKEIDLDGFEALIA